MKTIDKIRTIESIAKATSGQAMLAWQKHEPVLRWHVGGGVYVDFTAIRKK